MAIKRKTHLNLSGSHHTLDSDNAFVGGTVYVTGSVSASIGKFQQLTGSLSGTLGGLPFLVAGENMGTIQYRASTGQWEITGSAGTSVAGSNTQIQFNADGVHGASSLLTFNTTSLGSLAAGTLVAPTASFEYLSGGLVNAPIFSEIGYTAAVLGIDSNVLVTQSLMAFSGIPNSNDLTGILLANNAGLYMFSGSLGDSPSLGIFASSAPDRVDVGITGFVTIKSGSLQVNSGSSEDQSFTIEPSDTAKRVNVIFDRTGSVAGVPFDGINVRPLYATMTTEGAAGVQMSGSLLASSTGPNSIGKIDLNVIAVQQDSDDYGSWTFSTTVARDTLNAVNVIAYSELDAATSGINAAGWDVNINTDATIQCTGSAGGSIQWYAQITKKMFLSGSGLITY